MKSFFNRLPDMECLRGDTLGNFVISADTGSFDGCRMQVIIARKDTPAVGELCAFPHGVPACHYSKS